MAKPFCILTPSDLGKGYSVVAGYPTEKHRDASLAILRDKEPERTYIAQNPSDHERPDGDGRKTL